MCYLYEKELSYIVESIALPKESQLCIQFWGEEEQVGIVKWISKTLQKKCAKVSNVIFTPTRVFENFKKITEENAYLKHLETGQKSAQVIIDICYKSPMEVVSNVEIGRESMVKYMRELFTLISDPQKTFLQIRLPSNELAKECGMTREAYEAVWKKMIYVNYDDLRSACKKTVEKIKAFSQFKLISSSKYKLEFSTMNRNWFLDDGNGDFPSGEIYIAPIETSVNGHFLAEKVLFNGNQYENVIFEFVEGILVKCSENEVYEQLKSIHIDALKIGEFGIGLNETTDQFTGVSLFDEKIKGSCHIGLGRNIMFGGENDAPVHLDFVSQNFKLYANEGSLLNEKF